MCSTRILILVCTHNVHHAWEGGSPRSCMFRTCTYVCICTGALTRHACAYVAQVRLVRTLVHVVALCACVRACVRACARYVGQEMPSCPGNVVGCAGDSSCEDCPTWLPLTAQLLRLLRGSSEFSKCQWQDNKCGVGMKRESRFKIK